MDPVTGVPTLLYTGVRLRTNPFTTLPAPPLAYDPGLRHIETQCAALCDPGACTPNNPDCMQDLAYVMDIVSTGLQVLGQWFL